jgi:glyoxylase-like metal-dependent hydrolase (beta-lactamase superfamily II)
MRFSRRALLAVAATPLPAALTPGAIRFKWNHGSICAANNRDPRIQVVAYNQDTLILRENIAIHWEAPFTYLLAGSERACLIDTGATPEAKYYPLRATVEGLLRRLASFRNLATFPLTVLHTSGEDVAQNQGVAQFNNRPDTTIVPLTPDGMKRHFGFTNWPQGEASIDLGGRTLTVLPTPGTHKDGLSFYDSSTGHLFTGDLLFPGRILISNEADYIASLARLESFAVAHPIRWLLGGHIEMSATPGVQYSTRTNFKPNEHVLQLEPEAIGEALLHARRLQGQLTYSIRPEFILFNRIGPDERGDWPADIPAPPVTINLR